MNLADAQTTRPLLLGSRHMAAAGHPLAADAAVRVLEAGGNAVDAGVAAGFVLNVVQPDMASLGGVAPIIVRRADSGKVSAIPGVGRWPQRATLDAVSRAGGGRIPASPARWVVPASVAAWLTALEHFGTLSAGEVLAPAIELAADGFPVNYFLQHNIGQASPNWSGWENAGIYTPGGRVPEIGTILRQDHLARTLQILASAEARSGGGREEGIAAARDAFYKGEIAARIGRFAKDIGAFLRASDLADFHLEPEDAIAVDHAGARFFSCGPWSQGPALLQMLAIAERFDLTRMPDDKLIHLLVQIVHKAMEIRNAHFGDPDFQTVDIEGLLARPAIDALAGAIDPDHALPVSAEAGGAAVAGPDTTYVCVVDREGNAFSATPSDSTMMVTPMVPGLGFAVSDRGLQASLDPADPNCVRPGKRPRLTPNPGLMIHPERVMVYGTPGGEVQTQAMLQFLVHHLHRGHDLQSAVEQPRWASYGFPATEDPHPMVPRLLRLEAELMDRFASSLSGLGHDPQPWPVRSALAGSICAVSRDSRTGVLTAASDNRRISYAAGR